MWVWLITRLYALGMFSSQVTYSTDVSTKMYYADLEVENHTVPIIIDLLPTLIPSHVVLNSSDSTLDIAYFNITTECDIRGDKSYCQCNAQYGWDQSVCDSYPGCCNEITCLANTSLPTPVCLPLSKVTVTGSLTLAMKYDSALNDPTSPSYKSMMQQAQTNLSQVYSGCSGFDSLIITGFRNGSVIIDFQMILTVPMNSTRFSNMTKSLETQLGASLAVTTVGMVTVKAPDGPLCYNSTQTLECVLGDQTFGDCSWTLSQRNKTFNIVQGTKVSLSSPCSMTLLETSQLWRGDYTCSFSNGPLSHQAVINVDIALLPEDIQISSNPQYPDCTKPPPGVLTLPVQCAIQISDENYTLNWTTTGCTIAEYSPDTFDLTYNLVKSELKVNINCSSYPAVDPTVTCTYTNRKNQTKNGTLAIPVIYPGTPHCNAIGSWPNAKCDTTAVLPCPNIEPMVGSLTQYCNQDKTWGLLLSTCVNLNLYNILQNALDLQKGHGDFVTTAFNVFESLKNSTGVSNTINTYQNMHTSVNILAIVGNAASQDVMLNDSILPNLLASASNLLDKSLESSWTPQYSKDVNEKLPVTYLMSMEDLVRTVKINSSSTSNNDTFRQPNVELTSCSGAQCNNSVFNISVSMRDQMKGTAKIIGYQNLGNLLANMTDMNFNSIVMSAMMQDSDLTKEIAITFPLFKERPPNFKILCVFWDNEKNLWSDEGCRWDTTSSGNNMTCLCTHLTSFSTLMSKSAIKLPYLDEITYAGLAASISSLVICLVIEFMVWNTVVKSNISHFRHTALVNISLCLLIGDCVFLISSYFGVKLPKWCCTFTVIQHFCYLSMFFWMLCLSTMLLHQLIFVFHQMRKKVYLTISICIGYICPLIIVILTYMIYNNGAGNVYYNTRTCWLNYNGPFNGSIHAFIFPVLTIVIINFFSMMVVITKLLRPQVSEANKGDQKEMAKSILKAIVFLTPVFGVTWILGFFVLVVDLTQGFWAQFVNYAFTIINSLQGVLILLTGCFGEKKVRDAILKHFVSPTTSPSKNEISTKGSSIKK